MNVHALTATRVNADGRREILGLDVATCEDGAGWLAFLRGLVARSLSGVQRNGPMYFAAAHCLRISIGRRVTGPTQKEPR